MNELAFGYFTEWLKRRSGIPYLPYQYKVEIDLNKLSNKRDILENGWYHLQLGDLSVN